jgi:uncharacterized membrane protein YbhN (UPF0104 family)
MARRILTYAFAAAAVAGLAIAVYSQRGAFEQGLTRLGWGPALLAVPGALIAIVVSALAWRGAMGAVGAKLGVGLALRVYFLSGLGKYIPGSVWPVVAQMEMVRSVGVARPVSAAGSILAMAAGVVTSSGVASACGFSLGAKTLETYWWAALVIPLGLVGISPPVIRRLSRVAARVLRRPSLALPHVSWRGLGICLAWSTATWLAYGIHAWVLLHALGAQNLSFPSAVGAFALAWLIGFLVVIAPAGAGAREAALVVALSGMVSVADALVFAVVSRAILTLIDAALGAVGAWTARRPAPSFRFGG